MGHSTSHIRCKRDSSLYCFCLCCWFSCMLYNLCLYCSRLFDGSACWSHSLLFLSSNLERPWTAITLWPAELLSTLQLMASILDRGVFECCDSFGLGISPGYITTCTAVRLQIVIECMWQYWMNFSPFLSVVLDSWQDHLLAASAEHIDKCSAHLCERIRILTFDLFNRCISLQKDLLISHMRSIYADGPKYLCTCGPKERRSCPLSVKPEESERSQDWWMTGLSVLPASVMLSLCSRCITLAFRLYLYPTYWSKS